MRDPYETRVDARAFLNLPGFHASAFVYAYVEDTSGRGVEGAEGKRPYNPEPRLILEIADCTERISLAFEVRSALHRRNAFHKIDTLISALQAFRAGLVEECRLYRVREAALRKVERAAGCEEHQKVWRFSDLVNTRLDPRS